MPRYEKAKRDVISMVQDVMDQFHGDLTEAKVTINVLMAHGEWDDTGEFYKAPIKRHGVRCAAQVKINSLAQRAEGMADATITIDGDSWEDMEDQTRVALVDHELEHLEVQYDPEAMTRTPKSDDQGRPKLKMRRHDFEVWGFDKIIARHGMAALEAKAVEALKHRQFQQELPFGDDARADVQPSFLNV